MARRRTIATNAVAASTDLVLCGQRVEAAYKLSGVQPMADGVWRLKPDMVAWTDARVGYPCIIRRERGGHLSAYVGLPRPHPLYGYAPDAIPPDVISVPGGLNHAAPCDANCSDRRFGRHVRRGVQRDDLWWVGVVCDRPTDLIPDDKSHAEEARRLGVRQTYRDAETLYGMCTELAAELKALEDKQ